MKTNFKLRVKIGDREVEVSYPISERTHVPYEEGSALASSVKAIGEIVNILLNTKK